MAVRRKRGRYRDGLTGWALAQALWAQRRTATRMAACGLAGWRLQLPLLVAAEVLGGVGDPVVTIRPDPNVGVLAIEDVLSVTGAVHPSGYNFLG